MERGVLVFITLTFLILLVYRALYTLQQTHPGATTLTHIHTRVVGTHDSRYTHIHTHTHTGRELNTHCQNWI